MASAAAELFVRVSADTKGLTAGMDDAGRTAKRLGDTLTRVEQPAAAASKSLSGIGAAAAAAGLLAVGAAMGTVATQSVKLAGELEQNKVAFTTMLGSADKADAMLRELATFAASTPFELRGLTDSTKKLLAFGFDAQAVIPIMNSVGNAVAAVGGGKETLDGVTMALGQMAAKGKVSAEEMNQLAERGIPAWKMLSQAIGVSTPEAMKMAEKGAIDAGTAITALVNGMNEKFPGMMQKQSQTITGALSNLQDSADAALTKIGQKLIETFNLTKVVQGMSTAISNLTAAFTDGGLLGALDKAFGPTTKAAILGLGVAITASMIPALVAAAGTLATTAAAAAPFVGLASAIAFAAYPIIKNWDAIKGTIVALWDTAAQYTAAYYNRAVRIVSDLANNFTTAFTYIGDIIRSILGDELTNKLLGGVKRVSGAFKGFAETAVSPLRAVGSVGSAAASNFAETWRGAMTMSQGFTSDLFRQAGAVSRDFSKTLTADMLGLGKAAATAAGAVGKAAGAVKAKGEAAGKAAKEVAKLEATTRKLAAVYLNQEQATQDLGQRLADAARQAAEQGRSFDLSGAQAKAYADSISGLAAAFGKTSPQVRLAKQEFERLRQESEAGGKANADAYKIIDGGAKALDTAREKAKLLGKEWDETKQALSSAEDVLASLVDKGLRPGNQAYDEAAQKLAAMKLAAEQVKNPFISLKDSLSDVSNNLQSVGSNLKTVVEAFGLSALAPVAESIIKFAGVASAVLGLAGSVDGLIKAGVALGGFITATAIPALTSLASTFVGLVTPAVTAFSVALTANPIGLIVAGVAALVIAGLALYENWDYVSAQLAAIWDRMKAAGIGAFDAIAKAASAIWDGIVNVVKGGVNAMISVINLLIRGMNRIRIDIPGWVPDIGGRFFGVNIPQVPYLATGGLVQDRTLAVLGEGGRDEAVLPLNDRVYRSIAEGIAHAGASGATVVVNYTGSGKWTREDAQGLGRLLVSELRAMGVRA